jgi:hypothetical protein
MDKVTLFLSLITSIAVINQASAVNLLLTSEEQRAVFIELYTSEGCSSCPPADHWLSQLKNDPRLWEQIVPIAFHVDYWDYLGWHDRFANVRYSRRQQDYKEHEYLETIYTPGVMKNGREWRGWSTYRIQTPTDRNKVGILKANINNDDATAEFIPVQSSRSILVLNIAMLGSDLTSRVTTGENAGKVLKHDFVVLDFRQYKQKEQSGRFIWELPSLLRSASTDVSGIVLWVTYAGDPTPLQATGGWLR